MQVEEGTEGTDKPGSVAALWHECQSAADGHLSRTPIARRLEQPTRESFAGRTSPRRTGEGPPAPCLALLRVGFTKPVESPRLLVSSYLTVSPLPRATAQDRARRFVFCGTFPGLTAGRRYRPPCPAEPGLSSRPPGGRTSDRPVPSRPSCPTISQTGRGIKRASQESAATEAQPPGRERREWDSNPRWSETPRRFSRPVP